MLDRSSEPQKTARTPPYTSYKTFKSFIQDVHEHGLPSRIDRSILTRFSGVVGTQLMTALRFLGLMDEDAHPTEKFRQLVGSHGTSEWRQHLGQLVRSAYAPIFEIELETATPSHFIETFRKAFPGAEAVIQKSATFFLYAAQDAGVQISARVLKGRKPRTALPRKGTPNAKSPSTNRPPQEEKPGQRQPPPPIPPTDARKPSEVLLSHLDPNEMDEEQQTAVWALLKYFKAKGL